MFAFLYDYLITPTAVDFRLFKRFPIYRLKRANIRRTTIVEGWFNHSAGNHPLNTAALGNRMRWKYVLIEKRGWPRFIAITPDDPDDFVRRLSPTSGSR